MSKTKETFLNVENVKDFIGKKLTWFAPAYEANENYGGTDIIKSVDFSKHNPLTTEVIEGDNLAFAFVDNYGLTPNGENSFSVDVNAPHCFSYSDGDRQVEIISVED